MKLVHQINLAFGAALIAVLAVTGVLIHYVLLDHFIGTQKADMKSYGSVLAATMSSKETTTVGGTNTGTAVTGSKQDSSTGKDTSAAVEGQAAEKPGASLDTSEAQEVTRDRVTVTADAVPSSAPELVASTQVTVPSPAAAIEVILTDKDGNVLRNDTTQEAKVFEADTVNKGTATLTTAASELASAEQMQKLWTGNNSNYLYEVNALPQGTLTLVTPMSKIKEIEMALLRRLLIIFIICGLFILLLSHLITRKLITPLMRLKDELSKIKARQFSSVNLVQTGGEIGAVAQTVYEMAGELDRSSRVQKQFFQNASHELKSPLMSIVGYSEGIRDGVFEGEAMRRGLDIIIGESGRLKKIVTEMTLLAKLDGEEDIYHPAPVELMELLTETVERVNPTAVKRGVTVHVEEGGISELIVHADRDKLLQALLNVATNAVRHADTEVRIQVLMRDGQVKVEVLDDGQGIEEGLLPYLFHRFVKGKDGETGLGLAIARAIVERCGGFITAGNRSEGGAVVAIGLPRAPVV
ncbi:HAMP domain-containing histidine kinase [Paenibacillus sp. PR3]|uniref:histidine kinase n=1 Tax=Paenibacillus terricola TaxID=2763503 RepID=A0ABR8MWR2_9BACL|nr:HAMP domain-containing sensor histidine kinase [Paenibacillus terricola]MBD3920328.1 HAMP domain-containing histidine kinase [Paenibacillus terricola]